LALLSRPPTATGSGNDPMRSDRDGLLELADTGLGDADGARFRVGACRGGRRIEIALGPRGEHVGGIDRVAAMAQQMVGVGERYEALGVLGGREDLARILDPDDGVDRRVENEQRLAQIFDALQQPLLGDVVEKLAPDAERPTADLDFAVALRADGVEAVAEQARHMAGI
jgi:hypothetical protein